MRIVLFVLFAAILLSCNNSVDDAANKKIEGGAKQIKDGVEMKADTLGAYLKGQKEKATASINEKLNEIQTELDELKKDGSQKSKEAQQKLEDMRSSLEKKSEEIKNSSAETWEKTKQSVDETMDKANSEWKNLKTGLKSVINH